jgi:type IV secretory pathway VirD2 relaxase
MGARSLSGVTKKNPRSAANKQMQRKREESAKEQASLKVYIMDANGNLVEKV